MKLNFTKALMLLLLLIQNIPSFSQRIISSVNTPDVANFNGWVSTPNPITGYAFSGVTNRVGTTIATNGGLYAIANRGLGYRPSSSASPFTLTGTYRNNTGAAIAVGDTILVSYRAEVIDANSRIPGWDVTVAGHTISAFDWLSTNGTQTKTQKFVRTTAIANNTNFTLVFYADRGTGSGSSPLIGINDITVTILPAAAVCATPSITTQPSDVSVFAPNTATFNVSAADVTSYQWQWRNGASGNWANVSAAEGTGGTTSSFTTVPASQSMNAYEYRVVLTNTCGSTVKTTTSNAAILTINCPTPLIAQQPADTTITVGAPAVFKTEATNVTAYQWQWRANANSTWADVTATEGTGGTTDSFTTVATTQQMNGYQYRVVLTNTCGTTSVTNEITDSATLNICMPPVVTMQPADTTVVSGNVAVFQIEATNVSSYQWQWRANANSNWADVTATEGTGGTTDSFTTVAATQQMNGYQYRVVLTNTCGTTLVTNEITDSATLNICMPPVVTMQPADTIVVPGNVAVFQIEATNVSSYQWQWRANANSTWADVTATEGTGGTTDSFTTVAATQQMNGYQYRVVLTNACGTTTITNMITDSATLNICMPSIITTQVTNATAVLGTSAVFEVTATNATSYQWQWRANNTSNWMDANALNGTGATTDSFTTIATTMAMNGYEYRVMVTNECGATTVNNIVSDSGVLTVVCPPSVVINTQPADMTINLGANAIFTVDATNAANYQWQVWDDLTATWTDIVTGATGYSGQQNDTLIITTPDLSLDSNKYRVIVGNSCSVTTTSAEAMLTIDAGITVITNPVSILNADGFTSVTTFVNTGIGQNQNEGIRYSEDAIIWNPLVAGGVISNLQPNKQYYFQGYVTFDIGTFYGTVLDTFTLANVAGTTALGALTGGTTIELTINENNNPAYTEYAIASGTKWVQNNGTLGANASWMTAADWNAVTINELTPSTNYCFAVKARNNDGVETVLNTEACILTDSAENVSVKNKAALASNVSVYPNPSTTGSVQLQYNFESPVILHVTIVDLSGKTVFTTEIKNARSGNQTLDLTKLSQGMYFVKIASGAQSVAKKLMIAK